MDINDIKKILPHRYPFLLVDKVIDCNPKKDIHAIKNVTANEEFFNGHFPVKPVMPGVLIIEAMAQAAGILAYNSMEDKPDPKTNLLYFTGINAAKFKKTVVPGDRLDLKIELLRVKSNLWKFSAMALVESAVVCSAEISCAHVKVENNA